MKTFSELLAELEEKETDAQYNLRMRKTARTLKRSAKKGSSKRRKERNKIRRRDNEKLQKAAKAQAKKSVLQGFSGTASAKKKKADKKSAVIDRLTKKLFRTLKKAEPQRVKAAKAAKANK